MTGARPADSRGIPRPADRERCRRVSVLLVDDDPAVVDYLVESLTEREFDVKGVISPLEALDLVGREPFDVIVTDLEMSELRGLDLLRRLKERCPALPVVLITAFGSIELAVQAMRAGASDFVPKPFLIETLVQVITRVLRECRLRHEIARLRNRLGGGESNGLVARSPVMRQILETAERAASTDASILLTGASGTGKGALARYIHDHGARRSGPFVQLNCAALPEGLVESELFGVRRGAYTDAREERDGLFVEARGGTLFLDEIVEMPLQGQAKVLQALELGRVRPVGGGEVPVDVRLIAATNQPLEKALRDRRFRPDLYFRLNVIRLDLPPLRDRPEDIPDLVDALLERANGRTGRKVIGVSQEAIRWLLRHDWPGNVRELANVLERAVALSDRDTLLLEDLVDPSPPPVDVAAMLREAGARPPTLAEVELAYLRRVVDSVSGNMAQAARILDIDRRTLYRKLAAKT